MILRTIIFLVINFGILGIGSALMGNGSSSEWYTALNKAPWTPPGWVFGAAWTTIMICFSFYMAILWKKTEHKKQLLTAYIIQILLNVAWNPLFFNLHYDLYSLIVIIGLAFVVGYMLVNYMKTMRYASLLILPYFIWLLIATSLNWYITLNN